ncbi:hypothetical protein [Deinococcus apachensis]|uniref:hypothetical protein n=1 Tax=Deinococcus apachensis TaxID=309886 RepID=UPI00037C45A9|nr:hypothetical protein [Deinococcus apachensis]
MDSGAIERAVFSSQDVGGRCLQVDIVEGSQVHWRLTSPRGTYDSFCNVLEELPLLVAAKLPPDGELYEPLLWELELMGLRGP